MKEGDLEKDNPDKKDTYDTDQTNKTIISHIVYKLNNQWR